MHSQEYLLQEIFSFRLIADAFRDEGSKTIMELLPNVRRRVFHFFSSQ
jgi:hypothetical protein